MNWKLSKRSRPLLLSPMNSHRVATSVRGYVLLAALTIGIIVGAYAVAPRTNAQQPGTTIGTGSPSAALESDGEQSAPPIAMPESAGPADHIAASVTDDTPARLPEWVQAIRDSELWSDSTGSTSVADVREWEYLHVVGSDQGRLRAELMTEDGPATGWIDLEDIGVSGPPPSWLATLAPTALYASAEGDEVISRLAAGTAVEIWGPTSNDRVSVYSPLDPTSRRSGFGWVATSDVAATTAHASPLLPSPTFHPMPIATDGVYQVRPGDTRASIAAALHATVQDIVRTNGLDQGTSLVVGEVLTVPRAPASSISNAPPVHIRDISLGWTTPGMHGVVIDGPSGAILWSQDPYSPVAPASLTKIATALVTLDYSHLTDEVQTDVDSRKMVDSSVMGIWPGEELTVQDLLYGLMLPS